MLSYYDILNLPSDATKTEIKNRYKKLVKMYHPDINSSFEAEQKFKEINKAAQILLDDEKREKYDNLRGGYKKNYENNFKKEHPKKEETTPINGEDITVNIKINYNEAILGTYRIVNITQNSVCPKCLGHKFANDNKCSLCNGTGEIIKNKKITVKIPPSVKNKSKLRLKGEGNIGKFGGKNGNLYVIVEIEEQQDLKIENGIVYYDVKISPYTAILGGDVKVSTLWGETTIKIPPLTKANQSFKLVNVGIIDEKTGKKGDEIVNIIIQIPSNITDEEYRLYERLKEINSKKKNAKTIM